MPREREREREREMRDGGKLKHERVGEVARSKLLLLRSG